MATTVSFKENITSSIPTGYKDKFEVILNDDEILYKQCHGKKLEDVYKSFQPEVSFNVFPVAKNYITPV